MAYRIFTAKESPLLYFSHTCSYMLFVSTDKAGRGFYIVYMTKPE